MADKGTSQGQMHLMDEHGNRVDQPNATQAMAMGFAPAGTGTDAMKKDHHDEGQQQLHRPRTSSSSSVSFYIFIQNHNILFYRITD